MRSCNSAQRRYALMLLHLEMAGVEGVLDCIHSMPASHRPMVLMTANVRSPKDAIDTEMVQIIIRRPLKIAEVAGMIRACLEFVPDDDDSYDVAGGAQRGGRVFERRIAHEHVVGVVRGDDEERDAGVGEHARERGGDAGLIERKRTGQFQTAPAAIGNDVGNVRLPRRRSTARRWCG